MTDCDCKYDREFGKLQGAIEKLDKEMFGNGKEGMNQQVARISTKIDHISEDLNLLAKNVSGLMKFQAEMSTLENYKQKQFSKNISQAGLCVSIAAVVITIIIKLL